MRLRLMMVGILLAAIPAPQAETSSVRVSDGVVAAALRRAVREARERLGDPECRRVLTDFKAPQGRLLQAALDERGLAPEDYLATVLFYDGSHSARCAKRQTLAVTTPGSRVVLVCAPQLAKRNGREIQALVIHEMLHSLGLGEDPPSGREITARVVARCRL